jgi:Low affinity iron permease
MRPRPHENDWAQDPRHSDRELRPGSENPRYRRWSSANSTDSDSSHRTFGPLRWHWQWPPGGLRTARQPGSRPTWSIALRSITAIVTIITLFTIQHLQARDQMVIHGKLDEMLRALPAADGRLIAAEEAPDEHLEALSEHNRQDRFSEHPAVAG